MPVARIETPEMLDAPGLGGQEARESLAHVAWATIGLGGVAPLSKAIHRLAGSKRRLRGLDVGAGNGEVAHRLTEQLARRGIALEWTLLDVAPGLLPGRGGERFWSVAADALALPFADGAFDVVVSVLTLHHFGPDAAVRVLREMRRVAALGIVTSDLRRCRSGLWGARLFAHTIWRGNRLTRNDAPLSVRRSYTASEVRHMAEAAGCERAAVEHHFPFRLLLSEDRRRVPAGIQRA